MSTWKERLIEKKLLLADGAWGTELAQRGLPPGEAPEKWNLEEPDEVRGVAAAYVEAGSDIILTNTFGGNRPTLERAGLADKSAEVNRIGVALSLEAASGKALVFASIGPTGELMEPYGTAGVADVTGWFAEQASAIAAAGADGFVIESMSDLGEAKAALRAVRENSALPVVVSMTFALGAKGPATIMGIRPEQAAEELDKAGADIVGANCGSGIEEIIEVARRMRTATHLPLWCKPNAGVPELVDGRTVFKQTPEETARHVPALVQAGANIVGACCGSTPDHIRLIAEKLPKIIRDLLTFRDPLAELKL